MGLSPQSSEAQAAAQALVQDAKAYIGSSLSVELCEEGAIERSQGKAKRVLDLRKN
jgi:phenylacetate-CoA ligase